MTPTTTTTATTVSGHFHSDTCSTNVLPIKFFYGILCIPEVFKFNKSKTWGVASNPNIMESSKFLKLPFYLFFPSVITKVSNIHFVSSNRHLYNGVKFA